MEQRHIQYVYVYESWSETKENCQRAKRHIQCVHVLRWKSIRKKIANGLTAVTDGLMQMQIRIQIIVDVAVVVVRTVFRTRKLDGMMWTWCPKLPF